MGHILSREQGWSPRVDVKHHNSQDFIYKKDYKGPYIIKTGWEYKLILGSFHVLYLQWQILQTKAKQANKVPDKHSNKLQT